MDTNDIHVVLMAGGLSTRFGSQKLEHTLTNGKTILETTLSIYKRVFTNVSVVINKNSSLINKVKEKGANIVINNTQTDMSGSLVAGVQSQQSAKAWLIALADMPYIQIETLEMLSTHAQVDKIVMPIYEKKYCNPVIFGNAFMSELVNLKGDVGAKTVVLNNSKSVINVNVNDRGVSHDIDYVRDILPKLF